MSSGGVAGRRRRADGGTDDDGNDYIVSPSDSDGGGSDYPISNQFRKDNDDQEQVGDYPLSGQKNPAAQEALRKSDILQKQLMDQVQKTGLAKVLANKPTGFNAPDLSNVPVRLPADQSSDNFPEAKIDTSSQAAAPAPVQASNSGQPTIAPTNQAALDTSKANPQKQNIVDRALGLLKDKQGNYDQQKVVPLLSFLAAMGTAPTRSLGVALASGVGAGAQSYMGVQKNLADIARTQAEAAATPTMVQSKILEQLNTRAPAGFVAVPGHVEGLQDVIGADGKVYHYMPTYAAQSFSDYKTAGQPAAATAVSASNKALMRDENGNLRISPTAEGSKFLTETYGFDPSLPPAANLARASAQGHYDVVVDPATLQKHRSAISESAYQADDNARNYTMLGNAIASLSEGTLTGQGPMAEDRTALANLYNYAAKLIGINEQINPNDVTAQQIIEKLNGLQSPQLAQQYGERAARVAESLKSVLPGAGMTKDAALMNLSHMMVQNQRLRDFRDYANQYIGKFGTDAGLEAAFNKDMGARYQSNGAEDNNVRKLFTKTKSGKSISEQLASDPNFENILRIEKGIKQADGTYKNGLGEGIVRYVM